MALLYKAEASRGAEWRQVLARMAPDLPFHIWPETGDPLAVRYLAVWEPPADMLTRFPHAELVISVGAGVDQFDMARFPQSLPLVRMQDPGIVDGMVEYVTLAVLGLHRHLPDYIDNQRKRIWHEIRLVPASRRRIGILGSGQLGEAVCHKLTGFGFPVSAWSRTPRQIAGVEHHSGPEGLDAMLAKTDTLICLLPLTVQTRGLINAALLAKLPRGASIVNAGRGGHLVHADLLAALDSGHIASAFLDVTSPEPLPQNDLLWHHPRVVITPHVASMTNPETAVAFVLETIENHRKGLPLRGLVDRTRGY